MLFSMLAAAALVKPAGLKTFKDWIVGCDNGRTCQAVALIPGDGTDDAATVVLKRGPGPNAVPTINLVPLNSGTNRILADGVRTNIRLNIVAGDVMVDPADAMKLVTVLATAQKVELVDVNGKHVATVSPAGASAALRCIDDQQKRAGTLSALVAKGPSTEVPPPPALPVVAVPHVPKLQPAKFRPAEAKRYAGENDCEGDGDASTYKPHAYRVDATHTLVLVPSVCGNGAYNYFSTAVIVGNSGTPMTRARFDAASGMGPGDDKEPTLVNADWDAKYRRLTTYAKGRGIGDCGTMQSFAWDGTMFRLVEQSEMGECRGSTDYITTWRAATR